MKFKAHILNQVKVLYVSELITAPQPELRPVLFNVPAAISGLSFVEKIKLAKQSTKTRL